MALKIKVPTTSHAPVSVAFDGRNRQQLEPDDSVVIILSPWAVPTITKTDQLVEWFQSISGYLNWNKRVQQRSKTKEEDPNQS